MNYLMNLTKKLGNNYKLSIKIAVKKGFANHSKAFYFILKIR